LNNVHRIIKLDIVCKAEHHCFSCESLCMLTGSLAYLVRQWGYRFESFL